MVVLVITIYGFEPYRSEPQMNSGPQIENLAVFGGEPRFSTPLYVGRPNIGPREAIHRRLDEILDRAWLTNDGPVVREFEARIEDHLGVGNCIAMCNGTIALEIAIRAAGLTGEVIVPSFTFVATAHAVKWQGLSPVFADIEPKNHTIDAASVAKLITPSTTGIVGVHVWGGPCAIDDLEQVARENGLTLLFDAAHAFSCEANGSMIGNFGAAEVLSFHATKFVNSFEGGAITTNDDEFATRARLMRNFGFVGYDDVAYIGTNGKMSEIAAAMGLVSLDAMPEVLQRNIENYEAYREATQDLPGVRLVDLHREERRNLQYVVLVVDEAEAGISRDALLRIFWEENVLARRYFFPGAHRMEPYRSTGVGVRLPLPVTDQVSSSVLVLPTGMAVTPDDVDIIGDVLRLSIDQAPTLRSRLETVSDS